MQYDATTPAEYIDQLDDDWRRNTLEQLRSLIKESAPQLEEGIQYKMLSFADSDGAVFHLNAQKNYVSLYVGDIEKIDPDGDMLTGLSCGKGCIRFKKSASVPDSRIDEFIARTVQLHAEGADIDC